jgi:hypothetical protein
MAVVVPGDSGLQWAQQERHYLLSLQGEHRTVAAIQARSVELSMSLALGVYDAWHFSLPRRNRRTRIPSASSLPGEYGAVHTRLHLGIREQSRFDKSSRISQCMSCRSNYIRIDGYRGMGKTFSSMPVLALLSVLTGPSPMTRRISFTQALYGSLLSGLPIGKAARQARLSIKSADNPTWLAYSVFADPLATVEPYQ